MNLSNPIIQVINLINLLESPIELKESNFLIVLKAINDINISSNLKSKVIKELKRQFSSSYVLNPINNLYYYPHTDLNYILRNLNLIDLIPYAILRENSHKYSLSTIAQSVINNSISPNIINELISLTMNGLKELLKFLMILPHK